MKLIIRFCITLLIVGNVFGANEKKKFERSFKVEPNQRIEIINLPAMNVRVKTWDKNEVKFDLLVSINSSDEDYEEKFIKLLKQELHLTWFSSLTSPKMGAGPFGISLN